MLIRPLGAHLSEIVIEIYRFSCRKMHLKISSGKWRPFCFGLNVLISKRKRDPIPFLTMAFHGWYWKAYCLVICTILTIRGYIIWEIESGILVIMTVPLLYELYFLTYACLISQRSHIHINPENVKKISLGKYVCYVILRNFNWKLLLPCLFPQEAIQRKLHIIKAASSLMWFQCTLS